jgi:hypothetical protein
MAPVLNRTPLGAIAFDDGNGKHVRVYYQDTEGNVKESYYDQSSGWTTREPNNIVGRGHANTRITGCQWNSGTAMRVYFIGPNGTIVERMYNGGAQGGWEDGALTGMKIKAATFSQIACVRHGNGPEFIHVLYQDTENKIREVVYTDASGRWAEGTTGLPTALGGSSIAVDSKPDGSLWVYVQEQNNKISEWLYSHGSQPKRGAYSSDPLNPGCGISVALWGDTQIRLMYVGENNKLKVTAWTNDGWQQPQVLADAIPDSDVSVVNINGKGDLRSYYQAQGGVISEYGATNSNNWTQMQKDVPTSK